jgi:DNA-binding NtrC family response regulator
MTAFASVADAVQAMKCGAYDYLVKPFDPDEALATIERAVERRRLRDQARHLGAALAQAPRFHGLVGRSAAMQSTFQLLRRAAEADVTTLVTGESGTGKELAARAVHEASARRERRFVAVNCGALPENLIESELFGYVRGAFTGAGGTRRGLFEEAHGGTVFLDEIGELPLGVQVKLTRVLQQRSVRKVGSADEQAVDVHVVAATNVDLPRAIAEGKFREDLFYRLNVFPIPMPALRERREDIPLLAALFLERFSSGKRTAPQGFTPDALAALIAHDWPGNVRQLENTVARAAVVCDTSHIDLESLPPDVRRGPGPRMEGVGVVDLSYREALTLARDRATREYVVALLRSVKGNVTLASERAGIERESLHRLLKRHGVRAEDFRV